MSAQPKLAPIYRFGPYTVDPTVAQLRKFDLKIKLAGHPFLILVMLLERRGQLVTREEIRERLWGQETFVDFENSLNKAVAKLRQALCDSADEPIYIETIPRRGYRFIAAVDGPELDAAPQAAKVTSTHTPSANAYSEQVLTPAEPPTSTQQPIPHVRPFRWQTVLALGASIAIVAAILVAKFWNAPAPPPITSVAVLPLQYLSSDKSEEYLADGITDELTTQLAKLGTFRVTSRTSAMQFKNTNKSLPQIARALGVEGLVEGSLERSGNRIRIHSQLIRAATDEHLWAETYDGDINELMDLEDRAARDIAVKIARRLTPAQATSLVRAHPIDPDAHIAYLQGRYFWNQRTAAGFEKALRFFQKAIDKDPKYAPAYAGLADTYLLMGGYAFYSQNETIPKARAAAQKSLELEDSAEAHTSLGLIAGNYDWDWVTAEKEYRRAIELNPNYPTAHHWYGNAVLSLTGRFEEAMQELKRAEELDPLSPIIATDQGVALYMARRFDAAIEQLQKTLELYPNYEEAQRWLASSFQATRQFDKAFAVLESGELSEQTPAKMVLKAGIYAQAGRRREALVLLRKIEKESSRQFVDPAAVGCIYIGLGRYNEGLTLLEKGVLVHSTALTSLKVNPFYDPLRGDPRFQALLHTVHLDK